MTLQLQAFNTADDLHHYLKYCTEEYGRSMFVAGEYPSLEHSLRASEEEISSFYNTPSPEKQQFHFYLYSPEEKVRVGFLELATLYRFGVLTLFINYIGIYAPFRRKGYASEALRLVETFAKERQLTIIDLNVLIQRSAAQALYKKMGYQVKRRWAGGYAEHITRVDMRKNISVINRVS